MNYLPTIVLRHTRENLKKCSLRGLESRSDFLFFTYPKDEIKIPENYIYLSLDGPPLTERDSQKGLFILDATWKYAEVMSRMTPAMQDMEPRSLPSHYRTAYPRRQDDCPSKDRGLASIEAIFLSYYILGRDTSNLLDLYHWQDDFLKLNGLL